MMMLVRPPISIFSQKIRHSREKINTIIIVLILDVHHSIFPKPNIPVFQYSIIPIVSEANSVSIIRKLGNEYLLRAIVNKFFILNKFFFKQKLDSTENHDFYYKSSSVMLKI